MPRAGQHDALSLAIGRTTIRFTWEHDRWAHEILFADGSPWRSVEGPACEGDPRWPASPVLVELSRLAGPRGPAIVGVGLAGRSHFSASVTAAGHDDAVRFEIACRLNEPPRWLGSTYHGPKDIVRVEPVVVPGAYPTTVAWAYAVRPTGIEPLAGARVAAAPSPAD